MMLSGRLVVWSSSRRHSGSWDGDFWRQAVFLVRVLRVWVRGPDGAGASGGFETLGGPGPG